MPCLTSILNVEPMAAVGYISTETMVTVGEKTSKLIPDVVVVCEFKMPDIPVLGAPRLAVVPPTKELT